MQVLFFKAARTKARPLDDETKGKEDEGAELEADQSADAKGEPASEKESDGKGQQEGDQDQQDGDQGGDPGLGEGYGPHNVEEGHHVAFTAGSFKGRGRVCAAGDDGCTVSDETGREHRVHWHEVTGHHETEDDDQ
jgi:hypothetical protein